MIGFIISSSLLFVLIIIATVMFIKSNKVHKQDLAEWHNIGEHK